MESGDTGELNILVIDDDRAIRQLLFEIISKVGHQVVAVASAEEGLELLPVWTFQVAFIDHNLPGMEGLVLGEYLRRNNPEMSISLITGASDRRLERRSRDLGIRYISKPFHLEQIRRTIEEYLRTAEERRERRFEREDRDYAPDIGRYAGELAAAYGMPNIPGRLVERLVATIKRNLNNLRTTGRYTERDRVIALSGLIAAKVLGVDLPRAASRRTLYEEYDHLMSEQGRRREFESPEE